MPIRVGEMELRASVARKPAQLAMFVQAVETLERNKKDDAHFHLRATLM
jgi:hypothetical protein